MSLSGADQPNRHNKNVNQEPSTSKKKEYDNYSEPSAPSIASRRVASVSSHQSHTNSRVSKLNDIVNPLETEAERAIIEALEKREKELHGRELDSNIFPEISNDTLQQIDALSEAVSNPPSDIPQSQSVRFDRSVRSDFKDLAKSFRNLTEADGEYYEQKLDPSNRNNDLRKRTSKQSIIASEDIIVSDDAKKRKNNSVFGKTNLLQQEMVSFKIIEGGNYVYTGASGIFKRFFDYIKGNSKYIHRYLRVSIMYIMVPALILSTILFYGAGNPRWKSGGSASFSWILIFIFVRQTITYSLAKMTVSFLVDFLALKTLLFIKTLGPVITLMIVQSKGWSMVFIFWAIWDFGLLYGSSPFSANWLYWQKPIRMFNDENPNGGVPGDTDYKKILTSVLIIGVIITAERIWVAFYLGRKRYATYHKQLEKILRKILIVSDIARLSYGEEDQIKFNNTKYDLIFKDVKKQEYDEDELEIVEREDEDDSDRNPRFSRMAKIHQNRWEDYKKKIAEEMALKEEFTRRSELFDLSNLLGPWEEPKVSGDDLVVEGGVKDVLHYRESLSYMDSEFPFTLAFGLADTRIHCMESADIVFDRLVSKSSSDVLYFDTLVSSVMDSDGQVDTKKMKYLMKVFTPNRKGYLTRVDFLRCCDGVYKEIRLFRAATVVATQIDKSFKKLIRVFTWIVILLILLSMFVQDTMSQLTSILSIVFAFKFCFSDTTSKFFEGLMLIINQEPFDIGDRIALSKPDKDTNSNGSTTWFVESFSIYTTTVRNAATNEVATYSNGAISSLRIINAARSPKACVYVYMQFGIEVPYNKIVVFRSVIESFVKERPSEWVGLLGFRANNIEVNQGFIMYVLVLQHMNAWQNIGPILKSKADVSSYCLEVSKQMDMRYVAPPKPIILSSGKLKSSDNDWSGDDEENMGTVTNEGNTESAFEQDITTFISGL